MFKTITFAKFIESWQNTESLYGMLKSMEKTVDNDYTQMWELPQKIVQLFHVASREFRFQKDFDDFKNNVELYLYDLKKMAPKKLEGKSETDKNKQVLFANIDRAITSVTGANFPKD